MRRGYIEQNAEGAEGAIVQYGVFHNQTEGEPTMSRKNAVPAAPAAPAAPAVPAAPAAPAVPAVVTGKLDFIPAVVGRGRKPSATAFTTAIDGLAVREYVDITNVRYPDNMVTAANHRADEARHYISRTVKGRKLIIRDF